MKRIVLLLGILFSLSYASATTVEKTDLTNRAAGTFQHAPKAALNTRTGKTLVVWQQHNGTDSARSIWGRFISSDGTPAGSSFAIINGPNAQQPEIIYNPSSNQFVLVYRNDKKETNRFDIFAVRLTAKGAKLGKTIRISERSDASLKMTTFNARITRDATTNGYVILWTRQATDDSNRKHEGLFAGIRNANLTLRKKTVRLHPLLREDDNLKGPFLQDSVIHPVTGKLVVAGYVIQSFASFNWSYFVSTLDPALQKPAIILTTINPTPAGGAEFDVKLGIPDDGGKPFAVFVDRNGLQGRLLTSKNKPTGSITPAFNSPVQNTKIEFPEVMTQGESGNSEKFVVAVEVNVTPEKIWLQEINTAGKPSGAPLELASSNDRLLHPVITRLPSTPSKPFHYAVIYSEGREDAPPIPNDSSGLVLLRITLTP